MSSGARRLVGLLQPVSEYFKDEGGKRNTLLFEVGLISVQ